MTQTLGNLLEAQLLKAVKTGNELDLRKIFLSQAKANVSYFLNDYWLTDRTQFPSQTLLHASCAFGNVPITTLLLSKDGNPNVRDGHDNTPLHVACQRGYPGVISVLLQYSADTSLTNADGLLCWEMNIDSDSTRTLVDTLKQRMEELGALQPRPFATEKFSEDVKKLNNQSSMYDIFDVLMDNTQFENAEEQNAVKESRVEWVDELAEFGIAKLQDITETEHLTWACDLDLPVIYEYGIDYILKLEREELRTKISTLELSTPVSKVLILANSILNGKYSQLELEHWEHYFIDNEVRILQEVQNMHESIWVDLEMPQDLKQALHTVVDWFSVLTSTATTTEEILRPENEIIMRLKEVASCATFHGSCLYVGSMSGHVYVWSADHRDHLHTFHLQYEDENGRMVGEQITHIVFVDVRSNSHVLTASVDGFISAWILHSPHPNQQGKCLERWLTHHGHIRDMMIPDRSENVFSIGVDGFLRVRNLKYEGKVIHTFRRSDDSLTCMTALSVSKVVLGSDDGCILQVDIRTQSTSEVIQLPQHEPVRCMCLNQENNHLFFVFDEFHVGIIDIENWQMVGKFAESMGRHVGIVNSIQIRSGLVWTASEDNTFRAWDVQFLQNDPKETPKSVKFLDENDHTLLEVWECMQLHPPDLKNGIQFGLFCGESDLVLGSFGRVVVVYDLKRMDDILTDKRDRVLERHSQLLLQETALFPSKDAVEEESKEKKGKDKKGKK